MPGQVPRPPALAAEGTFRPGLLGLLVVVVILAAAEPFLLDGAPARPTTLLDAEAPPNALPYPEVPRIDVADAKALMDAGTALFVDVRPQVDHAEAHVTGALSLPVDDVGRRHRELDGTLQVVTYCS